MKSIELIETEDKKNVNKKHENEESEKEEYKKVIEDEMKEIKQTTKRKSPKQPKEIKEEKQTKNVRKNKQKKMKEIKREISSEESEEIDEYEELEEVKKEYGHEGFVIYLLLSCGCTVTISKLYAKEASETFESSKNKLSKWAKQFKRYDKPRVTQIQDGMDIIYNVYQLNKTIQNELNLDSEDEEEMELFWKTFAKRRNDLFVNELVKRFGMDLKVVDEKRIQENHKLRIKTVVEMKENGIEMDEDEIIEKGIAFYDNLKEIYGDSDEKLRLTYLEYKTQYYRCLKQLCNVDI